ncbi:four helix bundle protein [Algoriphagus mannitolivorans]|uniref:four helix bundle protein n=1 Tax=Algoriphagus mannitolivorans TaxID=226504 RepID=UPI000417BCF0|nr:four helix bundle protein [Algoriphagus mannitolivorans]
MDFRQMKVFKLGFDLAMEIFQISKSFPKEERYSLIDQIRRSSRSVCANLGESFRKKRYPKYFISKITDADMENSETQVWLLFACTCGYIYHQQYELLIQKSEEIGRLLGHIINNPEKY